MLAALGRADDERQCCRHEQRVAETPEHAHRDEVVDVARERRDARCDDYQREADGQCALGSVAERGPTGDQHCDHLHTEVDGEKQRQLRRRRVQFLADRIQDRVDEADTHEGDDRSECGHPHGPGLTLEGLDQ